MLPDIGSCPICKGVLKQFVEDLSEKANNSVLNLDTHSDSDDENKCEMDDNDDNSVEDDDDAGQASYSGETEHGYIESLIDDISRWKRPSLSNVAIQQFVLLTTLVFHVCHDEKTSCRIRVLIFFVLILVLFFGGRFAYHNHVLL